MTHKTLDKLERERRPRFKGSGFTPRSMYTTMAALNCLSFKPSKKTQYNRAIIDYSKLFIEPASESWSSMDFFCPPLGDIRRISPLLDDDNKSSPALKVNAIVV